MRLSLSAGQRLHGKQIVSDLPPFFPPEFLAGHISGVDENAALVDVERGQRLEAPGNHSLALLATKAIAKHRAGASNSRL
jgi:hypothetical protein